MLLTHSCQSKSQYRIDWHRAHCSRCLPSSLFSVSSIFYYALSRHSFWFESVLMWWFHQCFVENWTHGRCWHHGFDNEKLIQNSVRPHAAGYVQWPYSLCDSTGSFKPENRRKIRTFSLFLRFNRILQLKFQRNSYTNKKNHWKKLKIPKNSNRNKNAERKDSGHIIFIKIFLFNFYSF